MLLMSLFVCLDCTRHVHFEFFRLPHLSPRVAKAVDGANVDFDMVSALLVYILD